MSRLNSALAEEIPWEHDYEAWGLKSRGAELVIDPPGISDAQPEAVIDIETDEKDNFVGLGISFSPEKVYYFTKLTVQLRYVLTNTKLIGHNVKADAQWLRKWQVGILPEQLVGDTMLASYVQDSTRNSHALKDLSSDLLGVKRPTYKEITRSGRAKTTLDLLPTLLVANYCGCDVLDTYKLHQYFSKALSPEQLNYLDEIELPTMRVLMEMEERGVEVNADYLRTLDYRFNVEIQRLVEMVRRMAPPVENVNSDKQVGDFLVSKGFSLPKTPKGKPSVAAKALEPFEGVPFVKALRRYSELEKLTSTYTKPLLEKATNESTYRLHANFNQAITNTGRLSSSGPNLQNIPTRTNTGALLRSCFVAKPGCCLVDADYSQIEPRLFAHFSNDPTLLKIFNEGLDLYDYVASEIGCTRSVAKIVWLALTYNAGAFRISQTAHIGYASSVMFIEKMKEKFQTAFKWKEATIRKADCDKYVETMFGRRIRLDDPGLAPNYKIQGSAAEVMKLATVATAQYNPVLTVHDELLFEVQDYGEDNDWCYEIRDVMESVVKLSVPLKADVGIGQSWGAAKDNAS